MSAEVHKVGSVLDASSSKEEQQVILSILDENKSVILDLSECKYVSSAGLRVMLYAYKVAASNGLNVYLVGVSKFFKYFDTVEECQSQIG